MEKESVGWVERKRRTHHFTTWMQLMGFASLYPSYEDGSQPFGASSNFENSNAGATVQPTSVQSPLLSAACHACGGTIACGCSPAASSAPSFTTALALVVRNAQRQ